MTSEKLYIGSFEELLAAEEFRNDSAVVTPIVDQLIKIKNGSGWGVLYFLRYNADDSIVIKRANVRIQSGNR